MLPDEALAAFLRHCSQNIGEAYFRTPRNTIKAFVDLLSVLEQNPEIKWQSLIENVQVAMETDPSLVTVRNNEPPRPTGNVRDDTDALLEQRSAGLGHSSGFGSSSGAGAGADDDDDELVKFQL